MSDWQELEVRREGTIVLVPLEGEVDISRVQRLRDDLIGCVENRDHALIVDLTAATYIDSAGINMLFSLGTELQQRQQTLRLVVDPSSPIARMLAITGLDAAVPTLPTRDAALAA